MAHIAQAVDPFVFRLSIFVLAVFVGYFVVWSVTPALLRKPSTSARRAISTRKVWSKCRSASPSAR